MNEDAGGEETWLLVRPEDKGNRSVEGGVGPFPFAMLSQQDQPPVYELGSGTP